MINQYLKFGELIYFDRQIIFRLKILKKISEDVSHRYVFVLLQLRILKLANILNTGLKDIYV